MLSDICVYGCTFFDKQFDVEFRSLATILRLYQISIKIRYGKLEASDHIAICIVV